MRDTEFRWLGVPIVQIPQNLQAYQEIIWDVKPDLIIETGVKHGGSVLFSASMLLLLEACGEIKDGKVIGVDIKLPVITKFNDKIRLFMGSSVTPSIVAKIHKLSKNKKVLVFLDSNHSHSHVLTELKAYAPLVSVGSYCIVEDTGIEDLSISMRNRKGQKGWSKGNNPKTAVWEFIKKNKDFVIDKKFKGHPQGFLKRIK